MFFVYATAASYKCLGIKFYHVFGVCSITRILYKKAIWNLNKRSGIINTKLEQLFKGGGVGDKILILLCYLFVFEEGGL